MKTYLVLLRGINVGVQNRISMAKLKAFLEEEGFENVTTYINSGNVILQSKLDAKTITEKIERGLPKALKLDSSIIRILTLTKQQLQSVVDKKPKGFGDQPAKYYSDVIFLLDHTAAQAMPIFDPREGVDRVWPGVGVIYSERLGAERTKSRLSKIIASPIYKSMTIRSWNTTTKLLDLMEKIEAKKD